MYSYRECIVLGNTNHSIFKVNEILRELSREWPGHSYDLLSKNCNHFCDEFCERLGVQKLPGNLFLPLSVLPLLVNSVCALTIFIDKLLVVNLNVAQMYVHNFWCLEKCSNYYVFAISSLSIG